MPTWGIIAVLGASALALFSRRPDAFLNPQFWAEDGVLWYGAAYNLGRIKTLAMPYDGYYQTFSRLAGAFATYFPLTWGPTITNTIGLGLQLLPIYFVLSGRLDHLIPDLRAKLLIVALYVATPYSSEWHVNLTQGQWRLALLAVLVAIATPPPNRAWKVFDMGAIIASGLTGPYALLLTPVLLGRLVTRRERWIGLLTGASACCGILQGLIILTTRQRVGAPIGFKPDFIARWIGGQTGLGLILGEHGFTWVAHSVWWAAPVTYLVAGAFVALAAWAAWRGPLEIRMLIVWGLLQAIAVFAGKQVVPSDGSWITIPGIGIRYRMLPGFVLLAVLLWLLFRLRGWGRLIPGALVAVMIVVAIPLDWEYPAYVDYHFQQQARQFDRAPAGTQMVFALNPPGWGVRLIKRP